MPHLTDVYLDERRGEIMGHFDDDSTMLLMYVNDWGIAPCVAPLVIEDVKRIIAQTQFTTLFDESFPCPPHERS
jgi:hypothetical protein